jgi:hypothetical protein
MNYRDLPSRRLVDICVSARRPNLMTRRIDAEAVVLDPQAGYVHQLNETARCVWDRCDGAQSAADIAADLAAIYDAPQEQVLSDVVATLETFVRLGLMNAMDTDQSGEV